MPHVMRRVDAPHHRIRAELLETIGQAGSCGLVRTVGL